MLKPSKMCKVRLIAAREYYNELLSGLQDLGAVQVEVTSEPAQKFLSGGEGFDYKEVSDLAQRFRGLESQLEPQPSNEKFTFRDFAQLRKMAGSVMIDDRVAEIRREQERISAEIHDKQQKLSLVEMLSGFGKDISILNSSSIKSFVASGRDAWQLASSAASELQDAVVVNLGKCCIISIRREQEKKFGALAEKKNVALEVVPEMHGTAAGIIPELEKQIGRLSEDRMGIDGEIHVISEKWYPAVSAIREQLDIEMEKFEITGRIGVGKSVIVVEGWVTEGKVAAVEELAGKRTKNSFMLERIRTDELPPTNLDNPAAAKLFEFFIRFYSLPRSDEIDPTLMFALIFPIFFGLMVGDFGYGLIMLLGSIWLIRRLKNPPRRSRIPKKISSFVTMIVSPNGLNILARAIIPGSIISMVLGIAFNEYFGFQLPYKALFNVEAGLPTLLLVAGYIGVFMVEFGFALGFINKMAHRDRKHAIAKIGWMLAALGIVIFGLNVLHKAPLGPSSISSVASYAMIAIGIGSVLYGEGSQSLMEIPSIVSHILSYVRLIGILLTSVILAGIIDTIFINNVGHSLPLVILGVAILVFGQIFNIVIAIFESGIQGARLIYVEFFSKFFDGNGVPFRPFKSSRSRTVSSLQLEAAK
jgi:V/A-type H+-transporting ATPase subunit I